MTFGVELILHASDLSLHVVLHFFTAYVIDGTGVFLAISPVIAMMSYRKRDFWIALIVTEIYSFTGLFMSLSGTLKKSIRLRRFLAFRDIMRLHAQTG